MPIRLPFLPLATRAVATLAAVALAACGGDKATGPTPGNGTTGSFAGTVSGHVSRSISGVAYYGQVNEGGETGFAVGMGVPSAGQQGYGDLIVIGRNQAGLPAPGSYALHNIAGETDPRPEQFVLVATLALPSGADLLCVATTGTVTFRPVEGGRLAGAYTTQSTCVDPMNPEQERSVTLAGSFDATQSANVPSAAAVRLGGAMTR